MSRPTRTDKVLAALHRTFLNTVYEWGCDGYVISSEEDKEYHCQVMLTQTKGAPPYRVTGSCNCRDWRLGDHREEYLCVHLESLVIKWGAGRKREETA